MSQNTSPNLIEVLRSTLEQLEQAQEINLDDPALRELKRSLVLMIAELEYRKAAAA